MRIILRAAAPPLAVALAMEATALAARPACDDTHATGSGSGTFDRRFGRGIPTGPGRGIDDLGVRAWLRHPHARRLVQTTSIPARRET